MTIDIAALQEMPETDPVGLRDCWITCGFSKTCSSTCTVTGS
ncbi:hypothetical protein Skr01_45730 [Sphaerisporangium krabiense]|uniref:Uncharacterized protein n=1 Tax=Sphaerisporangium krabiense TaxID=763782 RepID=A0A7W8Z4N2_9ACTN|nr:hypothetical protein [Sphaerisporangium krabiense]MBB5627376.1 hypothetical protein [Sphaerisporangium krabiense]GII64488.1 hypothetical protein Skr01_45730 [Sphaerisporangium krabiense]